MSLLVGRRPRFAPLSAPPLAMFAALLGLTARAAPAPAQTLADLPDDFFSGANFRYVGPVGNRVSAVIGEPGNPNVYYFGAASGGVFKSEDSGHTWRPIFDDQEAQSIGALAVAPPDPNVVWAGTGEAFIRSNVSIGNGVYRSTDGGDNWSHMGLPLSGRIGRIAIHPTNPDIVFVAAAGHLYGPQEERGLYRTEDGGETWEQVLASGVNSGAIDVVMNPSNPRIMFAATWQMQIWTWGRESGGPESGLWMSRDGGDNWTRLEGNGLPRGMMGRIGLGVTPDDPDRVYALIETSSNAEFEAFDEHEGTLWRSDDDGRSWSMVNADHALAQRPPYYSRMAVSPDDANEVHFMSTAHSKSLDGGLTFTSLGGGDNHDMWIDPLLPDRMIVGNDQGVKISTNRGRNWYRPLLPIAQMYHVFTDTKVPYNLYGNRQDGPSSGGPSNTLSGGSIPIGAFRSVGGCESGFAVPDTVTNDVVWSGCYEGILDRHQLSTGISRTVSVWPDNPEGWAARDLRYRFQWTFPVQHLTPRQRNRVRGQPARAPHAGWRPVVAADQSGPNSKRHDPSAKDGRPHDRGCEPNVRFGAVRDRGVADRARTHLDGLERWARTAHERQRRDMDRCDGEHPRSSGVGHGEQRRAVAFRSGGGVYHRRLPPARQQRSVHLRHG